MKIKVSALLAAYPTIVAIINEKRPLPQKGNYRIGRMYDHLTPEFKRADSERSELVKKFGEEIKEAPKTKEDPLGQGEPQPTGRWQVRQDSPRWPEFEAAVNEFLAQEIEVVGEPIPLASLGDAGSIEAHEFLALGALVRE